MAGVWRRIWGSGLALSGQYAATLAVGMGGASALMSLMLALGYTPLPYRDPGRLVAVWERANSGSAVLAISGPDLSDMAAATHGIFRELGALSIPQVWLLGRRGAQEVRACYIQASAFRTLGLRPVLGRAPRSDDETLTGAGAAPVWISYSLWLSRYDRSPSAIGSLVGLAGSRAGLDELRGRIAGVLPPRASIPLPVSLYTTDVWYILPADIRARPRRAAVFFGLGRLRPGVSVAQSQAALAAVQERLGQRYSFERGEIPVVRALEPIAQGPARHTMGLLALGVGLVFLVGCVNVGILMGAEGRRRRREMAIRTALGATWRQLWGEVAAEKGMLTLLSLGLGVALANALLPALALLVPEAGLGPPLLRPPPLDPAVLLGFAAFAMTAALAWSALLVKAGGGAEGLPMLASSGGGPGHTGANDREPGSGTWRMVLLAVQAATGICLLAAAALTASTYAALSGTDLGQAPRHTVLLSVGQRGSFVPTDAQVAEFNRQVLSRLERLPGTQGIALASLFPPPGWPSSFAKRGDAPGREREATAPISVSPGYFRTLGVPILYGRSFKDADARGSGSVAIISLDMAQKNWTTPQLAVGSQIRLGAPGEPGLESEGNSGERAQDKGEPKEQPGHRYRIVGVAANFTGYWSRRPVPTIYLPLAQSAYSCGGEVILRTAAPVRMVRLLAPQALSGMTTAAAISEVSTMEARWKDTLTRPLARVAGMLLLALLGLGLSVQGVYAVAAATAAARAHDLAVRCALGAMPRQLVWEMTRKLVLAVAVGEGLGIAAALGLRRLFEHWLGSAAVWHAGPIAAAALLLALAAAVGSYVPARAATRANPVDALRQG